ncbi:MAG: hypothetical protein IKU48_00600 [Clostridia bacterium]|nr:hypothetical protein [Clostridia bacterium]
MEYVDLKAYFEKLLKNWLIIVLCCVIGVSAAFIYSEFFATRMYQSSVKMSVRESDWSQGITSVGVEVAGEMIENCFVVLEDSVMFEKVAKTVNQELDTNYSAAQINSWVSYSRVGESVFFRVNVRTPDPELSAVICNAVIAVAPEMIVQYVANIPVVPVDDAKINYNPVSPNTSKNVILGFMVAFVLICGIIFLVVYFDKTVNDEEKLKERYDISILGVIPNANAVTKRYTYLK